MANQNNNQNYTNGVVVNATTTKGRIYQVVSLGRVYFNKPEIRTAKDRNGKTVKVVSGQIPLNHFGYQLSRVAGLPEEAKTAETTWAQVSVWGNDSGKGDGDRLAKYLEKSGNPKGLWLGMLVGGIKAEDYQRKDGSTGKSVRISEMAMEIAPRASQDTATSGGNTTAAQTNAAPKADSAPAGSFTVIEDDDELPF